MGFTSGEDKLSEGDTIDLRYEVLYARTIAHNDNRSRYVLFDRWANRCLKLSWSQLRKMFIGRDDEPTKTM